MTHDTNRGPVADELDIEKQQLGATYAKALLGAAEPKQSSEAVVGELDAFVNEVLQSSPRFEATLASPRVAPSKGNRIHV